MGFTHTPTSPHGYLDINHLTAFSSCLMHILHIWNFYQDSIPGIFLIFDLRFFKEQPNDIITQGTNLIFENYLGEI